MGWTVDMEPNQEFLQALVVETQHHRDVEKRLFPNRLALQQVLDRFSWQSAASASSACVSFFSTIAVRIS